MCTVLAVFGLCMLCVYYACCVCPVPVRAEVTLRGLLVDGNSAQDGGGLSLFSAFAYVSNCVFRNNHVELTVASESSLGGGVSCMSSRLAITSSTLTANQAVGGYGGALFSLFCSPTITNVTIDSNWANHGIASL